VAEVVFFFIFQRVRYVTLDNNVTCTQTDMYKYRMKCIRGYREVLYIGGCPQACENLAGRGEGCSFLKHKYNPSSVL